MRKICLRLLLLLLPLILVFSCDYVKFPVQDYVPGSGGPGEKRKVLLEDYTGHRCGTCPPAAVEANAIASTYDEQVIVLSIHAGFLADPFGTYTNDFRTTIGTAWFSAFGFFATPSGMVNRWGYPTSAHNLSWGTWSSYVDTMVTQDPTAYLTFNHTYNSVTRLVSGTIKSKFYKSLSGMHRLVIVLMQDSIMGLQLDNSAVPPDQPNYMHRHVLRDGVTSTWGDSLFTSINTGDSIISNFTYTIANTYGNIPCDDNKCHLIAFIVDDNVASLTYRQVIQAEEIKVK